MFLVVHVENVCFVVLNIHLCVCIVVIVIVIVIVIVVIVIILLFVGEVAKIIQYCSCLYSSRETSEYSRISKVK